MNNENKKRVYLEIPINYICVYNKLKYLIYNYGIDLINDCSSSCKPKNQEIVNCWNLFQLAVINYNNNNITDANNIINNIKDKINKLYKTISNIDYNGIDEYYINEEGTSKTKIICNNNTYELPNLKIEYEFVLNSESYIEDEGRGKDVIIDITSNKIISNDSDVQTQKIGYTISYNNPDDADWIVFNYNNTLSIKSNTSADREATIKFIQNESDKYIVLNINQHKDTTEYKYTFEYNPDSFEFDNVGGEQRFEVTKSFKQEIRDGSPIGEEIPVEWIAKIEGAGFSVNNITNSVVAEANDYKTRTGKLILSRPELGSGSDVEIPITQQAGVASVIYNLQAVVNNTILPALNGQTTVTVVSTKQEYYGSEPIGEPIEVPFTIVSERGYLKGQSTSGAVWIMTENISEQERTDALIISQSEGTAKDVKINIKQQAAVVAYNYNFLSNINNISFEATGGTKSINVTSTKQKTINGKNYGDPEEVNYTSSITSATPNQFRINKNTITVDENTLEEKVTETATFIQNESNKQFTVSVSLNAAKETYEYTFNIVEGTSQVNFNREGGSKTFTVKSKKQKYLNGSPQGNEEDVSFEISVTGEGFSVSGTTLKATENRTTTQRTGNIKFIQNESGKYIDIGIIQVAGSISYKYTFNVSPTEFYNLPNYESSGITKSYSVTSYKEKYVNDNKEGEPIDVNFTVSSNQSWCHVTANNGKSFTVDENLSSSRTAIITLTQTENPNSGAKTKTINISQKSKVSKEVTNIIAPYFNIRYPDKSQTKTATVERYTLVNNHRIENKNNYPITGLNRNDSNGYYNLVKDEYSITCNITREFGSFTSLYTLESSIGDKVGSVVYTGLTDVSVAYFNNNQDLIPYIYLFIPENYSSIYYTLITLISKYHKEIKTKADTYPYKQILDCWNLFQAAVIAYSLKYYKESNFFINFIHTQLNKLNADIESELYGEIYVDENNNLTQYQNGITDIDFKIDFETGKLYAIGDVENVYVENNILIQEL